MLYVSYTANSLKNRKLNRNNTLWQHPAQDSPFWFLVSALLLMISDVDTSVPQSPTDTRPVPHIWDYGPFS